VERPAYCTRVCARQDTRENSEQLFVQSVKYRARRYEKAARRRIVRDPCALNIDEELWEGGGGGVEE